MHAVTLRFKEYPHVFKLCDVLWFQSISHMFQVYLAGIWTCNKTCLVGVLIRSIFRGKNCTSVSARLQFSSEKSNELTYQQDMFCFKHASAFDTSNNILKNVDE